MTRQHLIMLTVAVGASALTVLPGLFISPTTAHAGHTHHHQMLAQASANHQVDIQTFAFTPSRIEITLGETVEWTNHDFAPHTATADDASWTTAEIGYNKTGTFRPNAPGIYSFHCRYHPAMTGVIVVRAAS
jgi:plastocyanin